MQMNRRSFAGWLVGAVLSARFSFVFPSVVDEGQLEYLGYPIEVGPDWIRWIAPKREVDDRYDEGELLKRVGVAWDGRPAL